MIGNQQCGKLDEVDVSKSDAPITFGKSKRKLKMKNIFCVSDVYSNAQVAPWQKLTKVRVS